MFDDSATSTLTPNAMPAPAFVTVIRHTYEPPTGAVVRSTVAVTTRSLLPPPPPSYRRQPPPPPTVVGRGGDDARSARGFDRCRDAAGVRRADLDAERRGRDRPRPGRRSTTSRAAMSVHADAERVAPLPLVGERRHRDAEPRARTRRQRRARLRRAADRRQRHVHRRAGNPDRGRRRRGSTPSAFVAVTTTRSVWPLSAAVITCVDADLAGEIDAVRADRVARAPLVAERRRAGPGPRAAPSASEP